MVNLKFTGKSGGSPALGPFVVAQPRKICGNKSQDPKNNKNIKYVMGTVDPKSEGGDGWVRCGWEASVPSVSGSS